MATRIKWLMVLVFLAGSIALRAQDVSSAVIQKAIRTYFAQRFDTADSLLKITFRRLPDLTRFASQAIQLQCRSQSPRLKLGYQTVWLHVLRHERLLVKVPVSVNVQIKKKVLVTTSNIPFRATLRPGMVRVEKHWIKDTEVLEQGLTRIDQVMGLETTHFIPGGRFLLQRDVQERNVIHPGDAVEIWVPAGNLVVTAKGIARSAGRIGQFIYVKDATTGKRIRARVESANVVIVANKGVL